MYWQFMPVFSLLVGENFPSFEFSDSLPHYKVTLLHAPASTSGFILRAAPQPSTSEGPTVQITQLPNTLLRMKTLSPLPPPLVGNVSAGALVRPPAQAEGGAVPRGRPGFLLPKWSGAVVKGTVE